MSGQPESCTAVEGAIDEALRCKESGKAETILFGLTGTGYFDMTAYQSFHDGTMTDYITRMRIRSAASASSPRSTCERLKTRTDESRRQLYARFDL